MVDLITVSVRDLQPEATIPTPEVLLARPSFEGLSLPTRYGGWVREN